MHEVKHMHKPLQNPGTKSVIIMIASFPLIIPIIPACLGPTPAVELNFQRLNPKYLKEIAHELSTDQEVFGKSFHITNT